MSIPASGTASALATTGTEELELVSQPRSRVWARLRTHPSAIAGIGILALYVAATVVGVAAMLVPKALPLLGTAIAPVFRGAGARNLQARPEGQEHHVRG